MTDFFGVSTLWNSLPDKKRTLPITRDSYFYLGLALIPIDVLILCYQSKQLFTL